jgi:hypothetical protein
MVQFLLKSPWESKTLAPAMCVIFYDLPIILNVAVTEAADPELTMASLG